MKHKRNKIDNKREREGERQVRNAFVIKTFPIKDHGISCWGWEFHYAKIEKAGRFNHEFMRPTQAGTVCTKLKFRVAFNAFAFILTSDFIGDLFSQTLSTTRFPFFADLAKAEMNDAGGAFKPRVSNVAWTIKRRRIRSTCSYITRYPESRFPAPLTDYWFYHLYVSACDRPMRRWWAHSCACIRASCVLARRDMQPRQGKGLTQHEHINHPKTQHPRPRTPAYCCAHGAHRRLNWSDREEGLLFWRDVTRGRARPPFLSTAFNLWFVPLFVPFLPLFSF